MFLLRNMLFAELKIYLIKTLAFNTHISYRSKQIEHSSVDCAFVIESTEFIFLFARGA